MTKAQDSYDKVKGKKDDLDTAKSEETFTKGDLLADIRVNGKSAGLWRKGGGMILEVKDNEAIDLANWLLDMFSPTP